MTYEFEAQLKLHPVDLDDSEREMIYHGWMILPSAKDGKSHPRWKEQIL